ncbi:hypothetical protein BN8_03270 [Fibrisoma limi BUZ 3]|uniref:Lipoprotein n=1 Tax=Fibrisoma limi BUZ 3 TaxID=1185876 RepID=I2GJQ1_9BACT|nr:hypothetical protein [Fibrisoma limi]CCH54126.1 hypothetical protein BN8_03270 [Fibrisoma limi BUZ 3]
MKKSLMFLATLTVLTAGCAVAQPGYNRYPTPAQTNPRADDAYEAYRIDQLDNIVGLTNRQEKQLRKIENDYDRRGLTARERRNPQAFQRLQREKQQAMLAVLTPAQRQKLFAFQQGRRYDRGGIYGRRG